MNKDYKRIGRRKKIFKVQFSIDSDSEFNFFVFAETFTVAERKAVETIQTLTGNLRPPVGFFLLEETSL